jgi:hypothetical protein
MTALSSNALSRLGLIGVAAGVLGVASAALMLAWPAQAPAGVLHHPFTVTGFATIQTWFFVHHLGLTGLLVGLARSGAVGPGRVARAGGVVAVVGMLLLAAMELFAIRFAESTTQAANEGPMGAGYGITTSLVGLGMLAAGAGVLRAGAWSGWRRFIPLLLGVTLFTVVTPGMFGGFVIARLAIGSWMALFGALGWALVVETGRHARGASTGSMAA